MYVYCEHNTRLHPTPVEGDPESLITNEASKLFSIDKENELYGNVTLAGLSNLRVGLVCDDPHEQ